MQTALVSVGLALAAAGCGGVTGVDDTGVVVTPPPVTPTVPGGPTAGAPTAMQRQGDDQRALVNQTLAAPLVVTVVDSAGDPVPDVPVTWTLGGSGRLVVVSDTTDDAGQASAVWTLGSLPGPQAVSATAGALSATFTATATLQYESVDAGGFHGCAITPSAAVYCWGYNGDGQLGANDHANRNVPTPLAANLTFRQLSGGRYHTCGITLAGIAYCWGANHDGRLGDARFAPSPVPVQAATPVSFASIGSGWNHTCGLSKAGIAYCWGFNQEGEVGAKIPPPDSVAVNVPRPVKGGPFKSLTVGGLHSCAIDLADQAWCWGFNGYGQLGDGTTLSTLNNSTVELDSLEALDVPIEGVPVDVLLPRNVSAVAAGAGHTCALMAGRPWCWGDNQHGQAGGSVTRVPVPTAVPLPAGAPLFERISAGDYHTCATTAAGAVWCWGDNRYGQRGVVTSADPAVPEPLAGGLTFASFSAGETLSCGVTTAGAVYCVGDNRYGQIGDGTNERRTAPTKGSYQP